jgi:hypothetical protein
MIFKAKKVYIVADYVIYAAVYGYEYSGLVKLFNIADSRRLQVSRPRYIAHEKSV